MKRFFTLCDLCKKHRARVIGVRMLRTNLIILLCTSQALTSMFFTMILILLIFKLNDFFSN